MFNIVLLYPILFNEAGYLLLGYEDVQLNTFNSYLDIVLFIY